jgi:hypothetical protein
MCTPGSPCSGESIAGHASEPGGVNVRLLCSTSEGMVQAVKQMEEQGLLVEDKGAMICDLKV